MAEGSYEYECMRAELLGKPKPDFEEFQKKWKEEEENRRLAAETEQEDVETEQLKAADAQGEELKGTAGKLEELNSILSATQKRLDRFKVRCGSVTEIIRTKISGIAVGNSGEGETSNPSNESEEVAQSEIAKDEEEKQSIPADASERKSQLTRALDNHVDRLDNMLEQAEKAQYAMQDQRKQMRSFLK